MTMVLAMISGIYLTPKAHAIREILNKHDKIKIQAMSFEKKTLPDLYCIVHNLSG